MHIHGYNLRAEAEVRVPARRTPTRRRQAPRLALASGPSRQTAGLPTVMRINFLNFFNAEVVGKTTNIYITFTRPLTFFRPALQTIR